MARAIYSRNSYDGGAVQASLATALTDTTGTTIVLANTSASWDSLGTTYGFWLSIGYGLQSEEKVYVPVQSSAPAWSTGSVTLSNVVRGQDGTTAQVHDAAVPVVVVMTATDLDEANYAVTQTVGKITTQGDLLYGGGANSLARLAAGTAGQMLTTQGAGAAPTWVDASNVWTNSTSYTVSGFANYLVLADVLLTQAASAVTAGEFTLTAGGKTVYGYSAGLANSRTTLSLATITTSGTITSSAVKNNGTGTLGTVSLTVIGLN